VWSLHGFRISKEKTLSELDTFSVHYKKDCVLHSTLIKQWMSESFQLISELTRFLEENLKRENYCANENHARIPDSLRWFGNLPYYQWWASPPGQMQLAYQ
jgi:hypothetical protein